MERKIKNIFVEGAIAPSKIAESIGHHQSKTEIGAHNIFLGQVRADEIGGKKVNAIEYTAQTEIANQVCHEIREAAFSKYDLSCMHIYHSLGVVKTGEICFFVFVSSPHRGPVFDSLSEIVNEIKDKLPIFGKELFEDQSHQWKVNQ
ncbi:MAG: molybdenum cofactor biosynthesis protein MoaE [Flavobacteriaceae bacterium]|nr:molybdenum cofactor biosynthesis protein MoaE [Flavobacteriaceae bacterium]